MKGMFYGAQVFNQQLNSWNVGQVDNMISMFDNAKDFNQCLGTWAKKTTPDVITSSMFVASRCTNTNNPDASVGPWCKGESDGCVVPEAEPSLEPSVISVPSEMQSDVPSEVPSWTPSDVPNGQPSVSQMPSQSPTI